MKFKNEAIIYLTSQMWKYSKGNRGKVVLFFILHIIASLLVALEPLIFAKILNIIQLEGITSQNISNLLLITSFFLFLHFWFWVFHGSARVLEIKNAFLVKINYRKYLINGVLDLPAKWHTDNHSGDTIDRVNKSSQALHDFSTSLFIVIQSIIKLISSYIALVYFNLHSSYIVLFILVIAFTTILKFDKKLKKYYAKLYRYENKISAKVFDIISNITTVIILRIEKFVSNDIIKAMIKPWGLFQKQVYLGEIKWFTVSMIASTLTVTVLGSYFISSYKSGTVILIGTVSALFMYVSKINDVFFQFAFQYENIVRRTVAVKNVDEITKEFIDKDDKIRGNISNNWKTIEISNLNFSYEIKPKGLGNLRNVNFILNKGEKIAIIGESGSGKTTFLKVLRGLYEPQEINFKVNNKSDKNGLSKLNKKTMLIPQEPEIFATTIRENITMGINHKLPYIKKFSNLACFTKIANKLPKKWDSSVVEKGVNLSGGEKQRLALARALLYAKDKEFLFMDESTSSVDSKNEMQIYKGIFKSFKNKTIICSIHKLNLLPLFDRIIVFNNGKVIADGTMKELLNNSKYFKKEWNKYKNEK